MYDGDKCYLYINGRVADSSRMRLNTQRDHIKIGALCDINEPWKGYLSHARIYNKCLSSQEMALLASELKPKNKIFASDHAIPAASNRGLRPTLHGSQTSRTQKKFIRIRRK